MTRTFSRSEKLVIASHNPGKISEIRALLTPLRIEVIGADELAVDVRKVLNSSFPSYSPSYSLK